MALTGRVALLAACVALASLVSTSPLTTLLVGDALILVLAAVDLALAAPVRALRVSRSGPRSVRLGDRVDSTVTVSNGSGRPARLVLRDAWTPSAGATPTRHRVVVPAAERRLLTTTLVPSRRGDRKANRVTVRSLGPLGLAGRQGRHSAPGTVRVLPAFTSRRHLPEKLSRLRQIQGTVAARGQGQGTEFDSLREYVIGDDVRAIDWRGTARRSDVVVRTYRPERDRRVVMVLDTGRTSAGRVSDVPRLDHAMDAALLLATLAVRAGDRVDLVAYDRAARAVLPGSSLSGDALPRMVEVMALLEPELVEANHRVMVSTVLGRVRQRSLVVLFTDLNPAVVEESLLPALPALVKRHAVLVAALADPDVTEMAAGRHDARSVYAAAAAEASTSRRRQLSAELRRRGVEVVDAPPAGYASAVADAYLALKAAGRL